MTNKRYVHKHASHVRTEQDANGVYIFYVSGIAVGSLSPSNRFFKYNKVRISESEESAVCDLAERIVKGRHHNTAIWL